MSSLIPVSQWLYLTLAVLNELFSYSESWWNRSKDSVYVTNKQDNEIKLDNKHHCVLNKNCVFDRVAYRESHICSLSHKTTWMMNQNSNPLDTFEAKSALWKSCIIAQMTIVWNGNSFQVKNNPSVNHEISFVIMLEITSFLSNIRHILIWKKLRHFKTKSLNEFDVCQCHCSVSNYFSITHFQLEHCQMTIHN